ncbi:MAG: stage II sporulation protein M [Chloroflexi bacterium]|nr:stage II sporulation protein M [Chloroflexota bacterium]
MTFKRWLILATLIFGLGMVWGWLASPGTEGLLAEEASSLKNLSDFLMDLPRSSLFVFIFLKNVSAIAIGFILSPLLLLVPVLALFLNGGLLGLVSAQVVQEKSLGFLLAGILPHGIFELPALMIGEAAALSFGMAAIQALFDKEKRQLLRANYRKNIRYLGLAIILLLPAALIETYVTPLLVG